MAHLTLVLQGREVRKFVLNPTVTTIGRAQDNDIVINNLALSRRHAQVERKSGRYEVSDLASQNGVFVNSERVRTPRVLENTDTITLGTYHFVFNDAAIDPDVRSTKPRHAPGEVTVLGEKSEPPREKEKEPEAEHVPLLVLKYNEVELQRFPLRNATCLVGRAKECDVQIAERRLSRKHCEIVRNDGERFFVKDLGSQNGTYVNRKRIREVHSLSHGDVLNFAEYSVLYLSDVAAYDGPDLVHAKKHAAQQQRTGNIPETPAANIEAEETDFPEAFDERVNHEETHSPEIIRSDRKVQPSDLDDEEPDALGEHRIPMQMMPGNGRVGAHLDGPFTEEPSRVRERRKQVRRSARGTIPPPARSRPSGEVRVSARDEAQSKRPSQQERPKKPIGNRPARAEMHGDVPDEVGEVRPDRNLDDWYKARHEKSGVLEEEDSSVLLRGNSSVSQILSTMMVDKRELDRHLSVKAKQRKFFIDVRWGEERIYSGPVNQQVTILGTDREADIQLKGRYVAGRHSILVRVRDSLLLVRLGSSSAARVNGLPKLQAFLKTGDVIQIDETTIRISED